MTAASRAALVLRMGAALALPGAARAGVCDYAPSHLMGRTAQAVGGAIAGSGAAIGAGLQAVGYYTLVHGTTGTAAADAAGLIASATRRPMISSSASRSS